MSSHEREAKLRSDSGLRERMGMGDPGVHRPGRDDHDTHPYGQPGGAATGDGRTELMANMREVTTKPRAHALGREGATWKGIDVGGEEYRRWGRREEEQSGDEEEDVR